MRISGNNISVLFLRSFSQPIIAAYIAMGLDLAEGINFKQYPPLRNTKCEKLDSIYQADYARSILQKNVLRREEIVDKVTSGYFDLILLCDQLGELFRFNQLSTWGKTRNVLGQFKKIFKESPVVIYKNIQYMRGSPLSIKQLNTMIPVSAIDIGDWICLTKASQNILKDISFYFKRELPYNRYQLYIPERPEPWAYWKYNMIHQVKKVYNVPLGVEDNKYYDLRKLRCKHKTIDVFYCCNNSSTLRIKVEEFLKKMSCDKKWNIVIDKSLPFEEYCQKMARSKITVSVSGGGWDCYRHYESVALGSLPIMDRPEVDMIWWQPFADNIFFEKTLVNLGEKIEKLLTDDKLRSLYFEKLEKYIENHMLHSKIIEFIIGYSLANHDHPVPVELIF
jgi:hypothetical protein